MVTPAHRYSPLTLDADGAARFDLHLIWPGLWHMHGSGHNYTAPYARQRDAMAKADALSRELGARKMIVRVFNRWDGNRPA